MYSRRCAARRFYNAVFRWHLVDSAPPCHRRLATSAQRPASEHAPVQQDGKRETSAQSRFTIRRHLVRRENNGTTASQGQHQYNVLAQPPVVTSTEKPFDSFSAWDEAIRYRSETGLLLQIAVPLLVLREAQTLYGQRLKGVEGRTGTRVEVGAALADSGSDVASITLSGTFDEVGRARDAILFLRGPKWLDNPPKSEIETPSISLSPWAPVVRESIGQHRKVEVVIPSHSWTEVCRIVDVEAIAAKWNVDVDCPPEHLGDQDGEGSSLGRQPVLIGGSVSGVTKVYNAFVGSRTAAEQRSAQQRSEARADGDDRPGVDATTSGEQSGEVRSHYVVLEIPLGPNEEEVARRSVRGTHSDRLAGLDRKFNVKCQSLDQAFSKLRIDGPDEDSVQNATNSIRSIVARSFRNANVSPNKAQKIESGVTESGIDRPTGTSEKPAARSRLHSMLLSIPKAPDGKREPMKMVIGSGGANLQTILESFDVSCTLLGSGPSKLWLDGNSKEQLSQAKAFIQDKLNKACKRDRLIPMEVKELELASVGRSSRSLRTPAIAASSVNHAATPMNTAKQTTADNKIDESPRTSAEDMKLALRALAHPVVLITSQLMTSATLGHRNDALPFSRGMTVSSFNSVTLTPNPIVSFNIRIPSRTWDAISSSGHFNAHVLDATPEGAALAHAFTLPYERPDEPFFRVRRMGASISIGPKNRPSPLLRLDGAISATIGAKVLRDKCVEIGDHMVVVAEASRVRLLGAKSEAVGKQSAGEIAAGLTYGRRQYRSVGAEIQPAELPGLEDKESAASPLPALDVPRSSPTGVPLKNGQEQEEELPVGAPIVETQSSNSSASEAPDFRAPEQVETDYFEELQKDDDEPSVPAKVTGSPDPEQGEAIQEEEEHDFGFATFEDEASFTQEPLIEDSAAAREEEGRESEGSADDVHPSANHSAGSEKDRAQRRPALDASNA